MAMLQEHRLLLDRGLSAPPDLMGQAADEPDATPNTKSGMKTNRGRPENQLPQETDVLVAGLPKHPGLALDKVEHPRIRHRGCIVRRRSTDIAPPSLRSQSVPWSHQRSVGREDVDVGRDNNNLRLCARHRSDMGEDEDGEDGAGDTGGGVSLRRSSLSTLIPVTTKASASGSDSSSGSGSTTIHPSVTTREARLRPRIKRVSRGSQELRSPAVAKVSSAIDMPNALSFLDPDSPAVTQESIQRTLTEASAARHPSPAGAGDKNPPSVRSDISSTTISTVNSHGPFDAEVPGGHETDRSSSPEGSVNGDHNSKNSPGKPNPTAATKQWVTRPAERQEDRYGTPEMPRGPANFPHLPAKSLKPRPSSQQPRVKQLPRAEQLPLSGYELLATQLAAGRDFSQGGRTNGRNRGPGRRPGSSDSGFGPGSRQHSPEEPGQTPGQGQQIPRLKPIYRKFGALNHRLLLQLQDELSELEEKLHRLDTADTQTRRVETHILPASRRAEFLAGGELQWHKTDVLGTIGFKLSQYNHVLASFTETQKLPKPSMVDIDNYRIYLATQNPIAEIETRFLDPEDDLVCLEAPSSPSSPSSSSSPVGGGASRNYRQPGDDGGGGGSFSDDALTPMPRQGPFIPQPALGRPPSPLSAFPHECTSPATGLLVGSAGAPTKSTGRRSDQAITAPPSVIYNPPKRRSHKSHSGANRLSGGGIAGIALSLAAAVLLPLLAFTSVPLSFSARITVVLLVGGLIATVFVCMPRGVGGGGLSGSDLLVCAAAYGAVMAAMAIVSEQPTPGVCPAIL